MSRFLDSFHVETNQKSMAKDRGSLATSWHLTMVSGGSLDSLGSVVGASCDPKNSSVCLGVLCRTARICGNSMATWHLLRREREICKGQAMVKHWP